MGNLKYVYTSLHRCPILNDLRYILQLCLSVMVRILPRRIFVLVDNISNRGTPKPGRQDP